MSTSVSRSSFSARFSGGKNGRRSKSRKWLIITASVMTVILITLLVLVKGSVSGTEFAPSHFQTREFSFYEIPFLHVQITPIRRKAGNNNLTRLMVARSWISVPRGITPKQWHLVSLSRGPTTTPAMASLLVEEMQISDGKFWETWNQDHPNRASVLWPLVQRLAKREMYLVIPELLLVARSSPGPDDGNALAEELDQWLVEQYAGLIRDLREDEQEALAGELLDEALIDHPDAEALLQLQNSALNRDES